MKIIERLPIFLDDRDPVVASGERVRTRPRQIIVWASVARYDVAELPSTASRFPAVVDTGFDETFLIQDRHLLEWGGVDCILGMRALLRNSLVLRVDGNALEVGLEQAE